MKNYTLLLLLSIFLLNPIYSSGQNIREFVKKRKEKVKEAIINKGEEEAGKKADEKIEEGVNNFYDKILKKGEGQEGEDEAGMNEEDAQNRYDGFLKNFMNGQSAEMREVYDFDYEVKMKTEHTDKREKTRETNLLMLFSSDQDAQYLGTIPESNTEMLVIMDMENRSIVTITDSTVMALSMDMGFSEDNSENEEEDNSVKIEKTGRKKEISGYMCEEYVYDSDDASGTFWITDKLPFSFRQMMAGEGSVEMPDLDLDGFPMESEMISKKDNSKTYMIVTGIEKKAREFKMSDYQKSDFQDMMKKMRESEEDE